MTDEEFFYKNFPQFCTEKGECLSPFYDLFEAGVEIATDELNKGIIQSLTKENAELKTRNGELAGKVASLGRWFSEAKEIIEELLDTQSCLDPYKDIFKDRVLKAEQFLKGK